MGIKIGSDFEVPAPLDEVWAYLLDVEKVAPCMPGAELTEVVDDATWKGKVTIKLGPVALSFAGTVSLQERDDAARRLVLQAKGMEQRGRGAASALVTAWAEAVEGGGTRVRYEQDLTVSGQVAQYSRGMMQDVAGRLTQQFADCVKANLLAEERAAAEGGTPARAVTARPVGGLRLGIWAFLRAVGRLFKRLFGRRG